MFSRTLTGIKNKSLFYKDEYFVYVEGKEDISFWKMFFQKNILEYKAKIEPVGGKEEIKKYIDQIINHNAKFIVAMDSDYRIPSGEVPYIHPRVVETECHSIENIMLLPSSISLIIQNLAKIDKYDEIQIDDWLNQFDVNIYKLMVADILVEKENLKLKCVGTKCERFLRRNSHQIDELKVENYIQSLSLPEISFKDLVENLQRFLPRYHIRGHFYLNSVTCFVCQEVRRITGRKPASLSEDFFYSLAVTACQATLDDSDLSKYLQDRAFLAVENLLKLIKNKK